MFSAILLAKVALCNGFVVMTYSICMSGWGYFSNLAQSVVVSVLTIG